MNYTYLLVNIALLLLSAFLLINKRARGSGTWKSALPAALVLSVVFFCASYSLSHFRILSFDMRYLSGMHILSLPLEELMFCILMPLTGVSIYTFLNITFPDNCLQKFSLRISNVMLGLCMAMLFFAYQSGNMYAIIFDVILVLLLIYIEYINKLRFMYRFYRAYILSMVLFYPVYFIITGLAQIHFYFMIILLASIYLFELFKSKADIRGGITL